LSMGSLTYSGAGVDIDKASEAKDSFSRFVDVGDSRVLNRMGAFASLVDGSFPGYRDPVLVLKMEEPGSKQRLAIQHGRVASLCRDLVNHLVNDIVVMGAKPLFVQDTIVCGRIEKDTVCSIVKNLSEACRDQGCVLTGGETSEQPGVVESGVYILVASIVGVVERSGIIDGSRIKEGDTILGLASNGLHTNGYSLVRRLIEKKPEILEEDVDGETFLEAVLVPHHCYHHDLEGILNPPGTIGVDGVNVTDWVHGMAHITGGGIEQNLGRIIPDNLAAIVDLDEIDVLPVFEVIRRAGDISEDEMMKTYNMGVGMCIVASEAATPAICRHLDQRGCPNYPIGTVTKRNGKTRVLFRGKLDWPRRVH